MVAALALKPASVDDFPAFYKAAAHPGAIYSNEVTETAGHFLPFVRIPSYAWILQPIAALSYPLARSFWLATMVVALAAFVFLWPENRTKIAVSLCWSVPVAFGLALAQDTVMVLLISALALLLWRRNHRVATGLVIALLACKVTFLFAVAVPFLRSRRTVLAIAAGLAVQLGFSFLIQPAWLSEYIQVLRAPVYDLEPLKMLSIRAPASAMPLSGFFFAAGLIALLVWLWRIALHRPIVESISAALAIGLISAPHCYVYDGILLVPLLAKYATLKHWPGRAALFALSPLPYLAILLAGSRQMALLGNFLLIASTCAVLHYSQKQSRAALTTNPQPLSQFPLRDAAMPENVHASRCVAHTL